MSNLHTDCTGYEYALGEIYGLRWFRVDRYGRLKSRSFSGTWTPGENVAECKRDEARQPLSHYFLPTISTTYSYTFELTPSQSAATVPESMKVKSLEPKPTHDVPVESCGCGFYAFTDPNYDYTGDNEDVIGVIKGYGRTLIGSHGFRCEKAEIVALCLNDGGYAHWKRRLWLIGAGILALFGIDLLIGNAFGFLWEIPGIVANALLGSLIPRVAKKRPSPHPREDAIRRNYPDVPIFPSARAMLASWPLTPTVAPSPESDPDFWTRP